MSNKSSRAQIKSKWHLVSMSAIEITEYDASLDFDTSNLMNRAKSIDSVDHFYSR